MSPSPANQRPMPVSLWELIGLIVSMMALVALTIDMMLPALGLIASDLGVENANDRQYVISSFLIGFGLAQLVYGPLADAFGRKRVFLGALGLYALATLVCIAAPSFETLLAARFAQGCAAAAARVIAVAIARDLTSGRRMAEVMSMVMTVFMVVPVIAPGLGQLILFVAPWRWIFVFLFVFSLALGAWLTFRLPETLHPEYRLPLRLKPTLKAFWETTQHRLMLGYTLAGGMFFGGLYAFLNSAEQIFAVHFALGGAFPLAFSAIAGVMAVTSFLNSRLVGRMGQRRLSHGALIAFTVISGLHALILLAGYEEFYLYTALLAAAMMLLGLIAANFSALAMEPVGHIAGTASAAYGFVTGVVGGVIGAVIGQLYNGTGLPLIAGQAVMGAIALAIVFWTERGKLFGTGEDDEAETA